MLSQLGLDLRRQGFDLVQELGGMKFLVVLKREFAGSVRLIENPNHKGIWGIFPIDALLSKDLGFYFKDAEILPEKGSAHPRFNSRLWAAFSVPLADKQVRLVNIEPYILFRDVSQDSTFDMPQLVVDRELIIPLGVEYVPDRNTKIAENILTWCQKNKLDPTRFYAGVRSSREEHGKNDFQTDLFGQTALQLLVELVEPKDRSRISIPLDVLARLLEKSARGSR